MPSPPSSTSVHPFDWVDDIIFILDAESRFTFVNAFALNAWNKRSDALLGEIFADALPLQASAENLAAAFRHALQTGQRTEFDTFGHRHQGWINITTYPHQGGMIVQIKRLPRPAGTTVPADHDALTGCLSRAAFENVLPTLTLPQVLAIVDLNGLKSVNTLRGHSGGDAHIRAVAHSLRESLPAEALICRWGGDEFVILTPGDDHSPLQAALDEANTVLPGPHPDSQAFSVGIAVWESGTPFERAFAIADELLQLRKEDAREATPGAHEADSFVTFSQELEALTDPSDLIQHALNRLLGLLDFDQAAYATLEENHATFSHQAHCEGVPMFPPVLNVQVPLNGTTLSSVKRTRATVWSTDYPGAPDTVPIMVKQGVKSGIVTPVFSQGQVVAGIVLCTVNRWQTITPHMRKVVELTALRLEHALELRRAVRDVRTTLEAGMLTLGLAIEARDSETQGHTMRAATLAEALGERLGLNSTELGCLRQGAYLHDLGKLCIPDEILSKPGKLTPDEWTVMQSHVVHGHDLASRIPGFPQDLLDIIRSHHERWDGSGYPDGLAGTAIPRSARIFAVCDVYDALISERPYKKAWSHEEAVLEIDRQSGRHFDPEVVSAFLTLMEQSVDRPEARKEGGADGVLELSTVF